MKYSIITINYNNCEGLRQTIESVIHQTYTDYEYIIIDGGSTDGSLDVIKEYADKFTYWVSEPDKGIYNAMNKGVLKAHGEYLNFMNSGDCFYNNEVLSNISTYLDSDIVVGKILYQGKITGWGKSDITMMDFIESTIPHQASFIRRYLFNKHPYHEDYKILSDWIFFVETLVFDNCSFRNIEHLVCKYEGNGISEQDINRAAEGMKAYKMLIPERMLKDYLFYANKKSPMLELIPQFNKTYRLEKIICFFVKIIIKFKTIFTL